MLLNYMLELSKTEILLLELFKGSGECEYTFSELAKKLNVSATGISTNIKNLRKKGYIETIILGTNYPYSKEYLYKVRLTDKYKSLGNSTVLELDDK